MALTAANFLSAGTTADKKLGGANFLNEKQLSSAIAKQQYVDISDDSEKNNGGFLGGIGYTLGKLGTGAFGILEGIWDYTAGGIAKLFGADEWAEEQFANNIAGKWNQELDDWYNPSDGWRMAGDVASGIGNSLVGVAAVAGAAAITALSGGTLTPVAAGIISSAVIGLGAAGMATTEAYERTGELGGKEFAYGALSGITEAGLEYVSGAAGKVGAKLFAKDTAKTVAKKTILKGIVSNFAGEAFEEAVSEFIEPYYLRWTKVDPNAENATAQQIGYAALVGGISGALMGGIGDVYSTAKSIRRGTKIAQNPQHASSVVEMARSFAEYESQHNTGMEAYQYVSGLVTQYDALDNGTGELTIRQKKLLGQMEAADAVLANADAVLRSKQNIVANAEQFIKAVNERQVIDAATGKPFNFANAQELVNNESLLTQFAVADALGQLMLSKDSVYDLVTSKRSDGIMQADFRNFQKEATAEQKRSVNELFGIDVDSMTYEDFVDKIQGTNKSVFENKKFELQSLSQSKKAVANAVNTNAKIEEIGTKTAFADGLSVYKTKLGKTVAVTKAADGYYVYSDGNISKKLTITELKKVIRALNGVQTTKKQAAKKSAPKQAAPTSANQTANHTESTESAASTETETKTSTETKKTEETAAQQEKPAAKKKKQTKPAAQTEQTGKKTVKKQESAAQTETETKSESKTETDGNTETENTRKSEPTSENKSEPASDTQKKAAPRKKTIEKARESLLKLAQESEQERLHGAFMSNGKQIISDGFFAARYNDVMEALPKSTEEMPKVFETIFDTYKTSDEKRLVNIDADAVRAVAPKRKGDGMTSLARLGDTNFQTRILSRVIDTLQNPIAYVNAQGGNSGALGVLYIKADNGEAVILPVRSVGGQSSDNITYVSEFGNMTKEEIEALNKKREQAEAERKKRLEKQRAEWDAEQREREESYKKQQAEERAANESKVKTAASDLLSGKKVSNDKVKVYKDASDTYGRETSVFLALLEQYGVKVPVKTKGFINNYMTGIERGTDGSWNYWHKKGHNANTASYFNQLVEAIEKSQPATKEAAATSDAASAEKPVSIEGKTYKDFTVKEFEALPKTAQEYLRIKDKHTNAIILMQLGDFYECFFEDAETASGILDLTLTGRNMGLSERVKMTGLPVKMFTDAQTKLNNSGYDVIKLDSDGTRTIYNAQAVKSASKTTETAPKAAKKETKKASKDAGKIDDFGEKIGGARKDEWKKRGLRMSDIDGMNQREITKHVKKENVWKRPNYVEAVEKGGNRALLYAQNEIYKSLNAQPYLGYSRTISETVVQERAKLYAQEIAAIQELAESAKTQEDFKNMGYKWLVDNGYITISGNGGSYSYTDKYYHSPALFNSNFLNVVNNIARKFDTLETRAIREGFGVAADQKLPRGYEIHESMDWSGKGKGDFYITKGRFIVARGFSSYEAALAEGLKKFGTAADTKTAGGKQRYIPQQLQDVHRDGLDYRKGKDAAGEDFLRDFGIKGGEFGNWLSETDRRESLNYGYDAFCDLADALDMEMTDISLNGTLSIGFGSRGQGLSGAAAHYEPARKVINLTKMNGAGSLAHEWWHAFEDYASGDTHQSEMSSDFRKMPEKTRKAALDLINAINYREATIDEKNIARQKSYEQNHRRLTAALDNLFDLFSDKVTEQEKANKVETYRGYKRLPTDAEITKYNGLKERAFNGDVTVIDELSALRKEVYGRVIPKDSTASYNTNSLFYYITALAKSDATAEIRLTKHTKFHEDAIKISKAYAKDGGYWDSNCEMLARAFAAYVHDKTGASNDYLTGHALGAVPIPDGSIAYIAPMGEERTKINAAFDALFAAAKEEGLISSATRTKPTTTYRYAVSESADLNSQPAGNKSQKLSPLQMKRAESFARKNIKGYENLTQAEQLEVEWTIASGWRYGVSESEILNLAKISAQIGTGIGFADFKAHTADGKEIAPDGACYMRSGHLTIYLNPNSTSAIETVTLEELTHALEGAEGYSELRKMAEDYYAKHPDEKKRIDDTYRALYKNEQVRYAEEILPSELTAHYIREMLSNRNVLAKMTAEKPSFTKRCIQWLKTFKDKIMGVDNSALDDLQLLENKFISVYNANKGKMAAIQGSVRYNIKPYNKAEHDIEANIRAVSLMSAVTELTGQEFKAGGSTLVSDVMAYYKTLGNNVYNEVLGDVELTRRGIKDSLAHGMGQNKAAAYKAVPQIISDGQIVDYQERWKGHNYDTAVIAAPVKIAGEDYYAAVVVRRTETTQRFYLHEIDIQKRQAVQPESAPTNGAQELGGLPSVNSIFQKLRNVKSTETKFALDMSKRQEKTSAATSINSSKLPAVFSKVQFEAGTKNLDIGGGKFDNATEYLATKGVTNYIYDPYNRSAEHNQAVAKATENGQSDTVTISNVLNVIDTIAGRKQVLENAVDAVKPDGTVYITVYEGNGSGVARTTGADQFQLNRRLKDYLPEVEAYFDNVVIKNGVIIAKSPIKVASTTSAQSYDRFSSVSEARKYYDSAIVEAYKRYKEVDPHSLRITAEQKSASEKYLAESAALEKEKAAAIKAVKKRIASTDSEGRTLTPKQIKWASGTKVTDTDGHIKAVYHGTSAQFNEFSYEYLGKNGTSYGKGFYFSDSAEYSSGYVSGDGRLMEVYLSIKKPLNTSKLTMSRAQVRSFLSALSKYQTEDGINPLSDYADIDSYGVNSAINAALTLEYESNSNDVDIVHSIYNSISGIELQDYYKLLRDTLGYDGIIESRKNENFYIIFSSNQAKNVTNTAPTSSLDIRYALSDTKGSDKVMTELPNDTVSLKDVITRKKSLAQLTDQFKGNSRQYTEGFQIAFTNAQAGLERVLKQAGVDNATSLTNYVRAGKYAAFNALDIGGGQFSLDGETRLGDSWGTIWKPIYNMNKADGVAYAKFQEYLLHWHNIDRMAQGKPVFGADVTAADSAAAIAEIEKAYPKFKGIAEKVWQFLDNNLQLSVDSGMYSQEYADNLREMYPHYVPTMREEHTNGTSPIQGKNNIRVNNAKKAAKGADTRILPIDDMVASQTIQKYSAARTNSLLVKLLNASEHEEFRVVSTEDANIDVDTDTLVTTYEDKAKNTHQITFFHNGNRVTVEVSRNLFKGVEAFAPTGDSMFNNAILNGAAKINSTFKKLVTSWNPFFSFFRNPIRDIQEAGLYTRYPLRTFTQNYLRARKEIANNGQYWQEAKAAGITSASVYDYEKGLTYKTESTIKKIGQKLEAASNAIEMAPRMAEYISAREAGLSVQEALLQAQDVTTNFGRGGVFAKKLNATIMPFLNPAIQGFSKMFRAYTGKDAAQSWINLIVRSVLLGIGLTALNDILNGDDDDYENLSDYVKENNYVIALGNGDFLKIPKGRVVSVIGGAYLRSKWYAAGDEDAWEGYLSNIASQVTPVDNFTRTIFSPFTDISTNTTWYGGTIESEKWSGTQPKDRYDETTSSIAIWLGKVFNYSPVKIDYLLDQYGGVVTDIVLPATTLQAEQGIVSQNLLSNSTTNSRWGTEFYSQIEKYTYKKTAGDNAAKGVVKYLNSIKSTLSDMYTQKREIQSDKKLSDSEKTTQVKIIQAAINALQKDSLTNAKYLYEELKKYNLSDDNFDQSYLDAVSVVVGEEFALKSYNKQVYEKAKKLTSFGIGYGTYYDYYFAVKYLTSSEENTSKKANVIAFTLAQDLPTVQKLVLIMSAGYKIKDGDIKGVSAKQAQRIVAQYITKMQLNKNEKAELAKLCGLTVLNGKIVINA